MDHLKGLQQATITVTQQQDVLDGAIKLYGVSEGQEAQTYYNMAHAALDAILDASQAKHKHLGAIIRNAGKE